MAKRLIIPQKFIITVGVGGTGSVDLDFGAGVRIAGTISYIVIIAGTGGNPKAKIRIEDIDNGVDIFKDPKPGDPDVKIDFYTYEMRVPVNGAYKLTLNSAPVGVHTAIVTLEERPTRV